VFVYYLYLDILVSVRIIIMKNFVLHFKTLSVNIEDLSINILLKQIFFIIFVDFEFCKHLNFKFIKNKNVLIYLTVFLVLGLIIGKFTPLLKLTT